MSRCCCTTSPRAAAATTACIGAEIALKLGPRFGLDAAETETVSWLVRYHLLLSSTAFKRDLADPKTIEDFVRQVQSPERLRLLLILTVVDIRAVGPGIWNEWKRTLLRTLFEAAEERLRLGHKQHGRAEIVEAAAEGAGARRSAGRRAPLARTRGACPTATGSPSRSPGRSPTPARSPSAEAHIGDAKPNVVVEDDPESGATRVSVFTPDREGLFYRICAGLASAGANIIDARIHTTRDGMALDNLLVLDGRGQALFATAACAGGWQVGRSGADAVRKPPPLAVGGAAAPQQRLRGRAVGRDRRPRLDADDGCRSQCARPARRCSPRLRPRSTHAGHTIHSAHIATYGERAVDVFYVTRAGRTEARRRATSTSLRVGAARGGARAREGESGIRKGPAGGGAPSALSRA